MKAFIKLELDFFLSPEYTTLRESEGCTGEGCALAIMRYLRICQDGIGCLKALGAIARECRKSKKYLEHIVTDFQVFQLIDADRFCCQYLRNTLKIAAPLPGETAAKVVQGLSVNSFTPSQVVDNQASYLYKDKDKDIDKNIDKEKTSDKKESAAADFSNKQQYTASAQQAVPSGASSPSSPSALPETTGKLVGAGQSGRVEKSEQSDRLGNSDKSGSAEQLGGAEHSVEPNNSGNSDKPSNSGNSGEANRPAGAQLSDASAIPLETQILSQLFADAVFMRSLEALTDLYVYRNAKTRYYCLRWFRMLRHSQAKPITHIDDAKRHLTALLQKGRQTRQDFHRWHNLQLENETR